MGYDRYGNRLNQTLTAGSGYSGSVTVDATTNRIVQTTGTTYAYDANGNMTSDNLNTIVYDAENHATSSGGSLGSGTYTYDGNGLRVKKVSGSTTTVYIFSGSKVIAEYDNGTASSTPSREYVYGGSALLAKIDSSGTKYYHQDHLSNRLVTSSTGATVAQVGHFPFGESWYNATNDKLVFTSYERDAESGNDYAQARTYSSRLGRFSSPDPIAGSTGDPQTLNRYSYARNLPSLMTDPTGMSPCFGELIETHRYRKYKDQASSGGGGPRMLDDTEESDFEPQGPFSPNGCIGDGGGGGGGGIGGPYGGYCSAEFESCVSDGKGGYVGIDSAGFGYQCNAPVEAADDPTGGCDVNPSRFYFNQGLFSIGQGGGAGASIIKNLVDLLSQNSLCASILGGTDKALALARQLNINNVSQTGIPLLIGQDRSTAVDVAGFAAPAAVSFQSTSLPFHPWNSGPFTVFTNSTFSSYNSSQQLTVLVHELHHVSLGNNSLSHGIDVPNSGADARTISKLCDTALPAPFNSH